MGLIIVTEAQNTIRTMKGGIAMSEEKKKVEKEAIDLFKQLDEKSILIIKSGMEILVARQQLETKKTA